MNSWIKAVSYLVLVFGSLVVASTTDDKRKQDQCFGFFAGMCIAGYFVTSKEPGR